MPTVQIDRTLDVFPSGGCPDGAPRRRAAVFDVGHADNLAGGRLATDHLLALGHRRLACLAGPAGHRHAQARLQGFKEALRGAGPGRPAS